MTVALRVGGIQHDVSQWFFPSKRNIFRQAGGFAPSEVEYNVPSFQRRLFWIVTHQPNTSGT